VAINNKKVEKLSYKLTAPMKNIYAKTGDSRLNDTIAHLKIFVKSNRQLVASCQRCAIYCPEKVFTDSQLKQLNESITANALIGRKKSIVLIRLNSKQGKKDFKRMIFHELVHIFCGKIEMDGEHFIDIYGTGVTPDVAAENQIYDGLL
jgi:Pyruvate/2-oxoacid:ferredoxin oxidoreductase delta subunit